MGGVSRSSRAWILSTLVAASADAHSLWVALPAQAAPCDFEQVAAALKSRLPDAELLPGLARDEISPQLVVENGAAGWSMELRAPGHPPLRRALPAPAEDCVGLSEAAALMADRYLDSIQWTADAVTVERLKPRDEQSAPSSLQGVVELGGGVGLGLLSVTPAAQLDVGVGRGPWRLEVGGIYQLPAQQTLVGPTSTPAFLDEQFAAFQATGGRRFELGWGDVRLDATPGVELYWVWSTGTRVFHRQGALTAIPFGGLRIGYEIALAPHWTACLRVQVRALLGKDTFSVVGYSPTPSTPRVDGDAGLAVGYALF